MRALAALPVLLAALALPSVARAYDHQATLELGVGWAHGFGAATPANHDENAAAAVLGGSVGLGDTFALRGALSWTGYPGGPFAHVGTIGAEVVYLVDVLEVVPYVGLGLDGLLTFEGSARGDFAVHAVGGVDWLFARGMYVGVEARSYLVLTALDTAEPWLQVAVTARFGLVFDL